MDKAKVPLTVRIDITVLVDVDDYRLNYGVEPVNQIREDVKGAVISAITSGGVLANGLIDVIDNKRGR